MPSFIDVFTFGRPPVCIELLTRVSGLHFAEYYSLAIKTVWDDVPLQVIDLRSLLINKKATGRHKDLDDLEQLQDV